MYRDKLAEFIREKNVQIKILADQSGISTDTITRIIHPQNHEKDSPKVSTLENLCKVLGIEVWELFYNGNTSLISLQVELDALKAERDTLIAENGSLKGKIEVLRDKNDALKDEIIATHNYYIKRSHE